MAYVFRRNDVFLYTFLLLLGSIFVFWGGRGILMYLWNPMTLKLDGIVIQSEKKYQRKELPVLLMSPVLSSINIPIKGKIIYLEHMTT